MYQNRYNWCRQVNLRKQSVPIDRPERERVHIGRPMNVSFGAKADIIVGINPSLVFFLVNLFVQVTKLFDLETLLPWNNDDNAGWTLTVVQM